MIISTKIKIRGAYYLALFVSLCRKMVGLTTLADVNRRGINWHLDLEEGIDFAIYLIGSFENRTISSYKKILNEGDIAIDIGANMGAHTLHLAKAVGSTGEVLAIEPSIEIFAKLKENLRRNPLLESRIQTFQLMLMAEDHAKIPENIYARWPLKGSRYAHPLHGGVAVSTQGAQIKSLDSMIASTDIDKVNLIKLDVDGYEFDVLVGAKETIKRHKPAIIFEFSPYTSEERNIEPNKILEFFETMNYSFFYLDGRPYKNSKHGLPHIKPGSSINILAKFSR